MDQTNLPGLRLVPTVISARKVEEALDPQLIYRLHACGYISTEEAATIITLDAKAQRYRRAARVWEVAAAVLFFVALLSLAVLA